MKVGGRQRLDEMVAHYPDAKGRARAWLAEIEEAQWLDPAAVKRRYPTASFIPSGGGKRVVFNLGGNRWRIDTKIAYEMQYVLIIRAGSHEEYDSWKF
jgi:mRNA interferase HigB